MQRRMMGRLLLVSALAAATLSLPGVAGAGGCSASISPNPGWRGATVTISGSGWPVGSGFYVNFGGPNIHNGTTNASGQFSFQYMIPNDFPVGTTNYFVADNAATCETNPNYQVNASAPPPPPPPTTTSSPTTTTTSTTTTTVAATTTTAAATTTTSAATTTTEVEDTTTTSEADDATGGGQSWMIWVIIALAVVAALLAGMMLGQRRRGGDTSPPPPSE